MSAPTAARGLLAVATPNGLARVRARRTLYATGSYDQNLPFADNDRPGVIAARALRTPGVPLGRATGAAARSGGDPRRGADRSGPGRALTDAGVEVERIDVARETIVGSRGQQKLRGIDVRTADGEARTVPGALIAVAALPAPASELPRQHGAAVALRRGAGRLRGGVDERFATAAPGVFACGDVTGYQAGPPPRRGPAPPPARALAATLGAGAAGRHRRCAAPAAPRPRPAAARDRACRASRRRRPRTSSRRRSRRRRARHARERRQRAQTALRRIDPRRRLEAGARQALRQDAGRGRLDGGSRQVRAAGLGAPSEPTFYRVAEPDDRRARAVAHADHRPGRRRAGRRRGDGPPGEAPAPRPEPGRAASRAARRPRPHGARARRPPHHHPRCAPARRPTAPACSRASW